MCEIKFVNFNGIKEYARVMYNDVKDADKYKIEVAYNGRDIKDLLEYLFELEQKLQQKENTIKEVKEFVEDERLYTSNGNVLSIANTGCGKKILEILKGEDKE